MLRVEWYRPNDKIMAGVCSGLANKLEVEPWLVRFVLVGSVLFLGFGLFMYFLLAIALPSQNQLNQASEKRLLGVCQELARRNDLDIGLTRFIALLLLFASFGWVTLVYVVLHFAMKPAAEI